MPDNSNIPAKYVSTLPKMEPVPTFKGLNELEQKFVLAWVCCGGNSIAAMEMIGEVSREIPIIALEKANTLLRKTHVRKAINLYLDWTCSTLPQLKIAFAVHQHNKATSSHSHVVERAKAIESGIKSLESFGDEDAEDDSNSYEMIQKLREARDGQDKGDEEDEDS